MSKKTVVFDFDGVIHSYKSGWKGATTIPDEPVKGISEVIDDLRQDYKVVIVSTRCFQDGGIGAIKEWLEKYNIKVDEILGEKPPAVVYIDDRAVCFNGKTEGLATQIRGFKNWLERNKCSMRKYLVTLFFDAEDDKPLEEREFDRFILECEEGEFEIKIYDIFEVNKYSWDDFEKGANGYKMIYSMETSDLTDLKVYR